MFYQKIAIGHCYWNLLFTLAQYDLFIYAYNNSLGWWRPAENKCQKYFFWGELQVKIATTTQLFGCTQYTENLGCSPDKIKGTSYSHPPPRHPWLANTKYWNLGTGFQGNGETEIRGNWKGEGKGKRRRVRLPESSCYLSFFRFLSLKFLFLGLMLLF